MLRYPNRRLSNRAWPRCTQLGLAPPNRAKPRQASTSQAIQAVPAPNGLIGLSFKTTLEHFHTMLSHSQHGRCSGRIR